MISAYRLYGAAISLYTGKVRAYLRYRNVPFVEESGSPEIFERVGFRMIPVLHTPDDELIQDTPVIIDHLEARFAEAGFGASSIYPTGPAQRLVALLFEVYGDEWLVIPAMHYRWAYNLDFILEAFGKTVVPEASAEEQRAVGEKISAPFRGSLPILGIEEGTIAGIESDYEKLLLNLNEHFASHQYLLGARPSIGDYGLLGPLYAHNYRDPWSGDQMRRLAPNVARWIGSMNTPAPNSGSFIPDDEIPETLLPLLEGIFTEAMPALMATIDANAAWIDANPDAEELPRWRWRARIRDRRDAWQAHDAFLQPVDAAATSGRLSVSRRGRSRAGRSSARKSGWEKMLAEPDSKAGHATQQQAGA